MTRLPRSTRRLDVLVLIAASWVAVIFARVWPAWHGSDVTRDLSWVAFMVRVLEFHIALGLLLVAFVAGWRKWWMPAGAALVLALLLLIPVARSYVRTPNTQHAGDTTRIATVNLLVSNEQYRQVAAELRRVHPDIVAFQEYSDAWNDELSSRLRHTNLVAADVSTRNDSFGTAVFTRFASRGPTTDLELGSGDAPQPRVPILIDGRDAVLYDIHLLPPIGRAYVRERDRQFRDLLARVRHETSPIVVVGDLNLTETTREHAQLRALGLRDAWDIAGRGRGASWPANSFLRYVPGLRLDHMYLSRELTATRVRHLPANGSDHLPLLVDVAWRRADTP